MPREIQYQPQGINPRAGTEYEIFAQEMNAWTGRLRTRRAEMIKEKAFLKGRTEGYDEDIPLPDGSSLSDRAYREGALLSRAAGLKVDITDTLTRYEAEANGDSQEFMAKAEGALKGWAAEAPPELLPLINEEATQMARKMARKMDLEKIQQSRDEQKAAVMAGLEDFDREVQNAAETGDEVQLQATMTKYDTLMNGAVSAGLIETADAIDLQNQQKKAIRNALDLGAFERSLDAGEGSDYMESFISDKDPLYSPDEREKMVGEMLQRVRNRHAMRAMDENMAEELRKSTYEQTKRQAVDLMINNQLTTKWLQEQNRLEKLPPDYVEKMIRSLKSDPGADDPAVLLEYQVDTLDFTESEIIQDSRLTHKTRAQVIDRRRKLEEDASNWRNSQNGKEGIRRIMATFGMVEGMIADLNPELATRAGRIVSTWHDTIDALPLEQRAPQALEIADKLIKQIEDEDKRKDIESARQRLQALRKEAQKMESDGETGHEYKVIQRRIGEVEEQIRGLEQ